MRMHFGRLTASISVCLFSISLTSCRSSGYGEPFVPGLGEIMTFTQMRHMKLWFAGEEENWDLASYETDELAEGFADVVRFHPTHGEPAVSLSEFVPEFTAEPIEEIRSAIGQRDLARFTAAYDSLTVACNDCHRSAGYPFNVVKRPEENPYSNQRFRSP